MINIVYGRMRISVQGLWVDLVKEAIIRDYAPITYSEALNKATRAKIMLNRVDKEEDSWMTDRETNRGVVPTNVTS